MKKSIVLLYFLVSTVFSCVADNIYLMNGTGYNTAEPQLIAAITANGHSVTEQTTSLATLPAGFVSTCIDPVNGYDWLCFFGVEDYSSLLPEIQAFIDSGGKVYYQYEITCCSTSTASVSAILSGLTGLLITPNATPGVAGFGVGGAGYEATDISCCMTFIGDAYKGLDGVPIGNQLQATATLPGSSPVIATCLNFGFSFSTTDFVGAADNGGIFGLGDLNLWYNGDEPLSSSGTTPVSATLVDYIFPSSASSCHAFPPGCLYPTTIIGLDIDLGNDTSLCSGAQLSLDATTTNATYLWQDNSTNSTFDVTQAGTYWVEVTTNCGIATDSIVVDYAVPIADLGNDTSICLNQPLLLDVTQAGASYLWQDLSSASTYSVTLAGTYSVVVSLGTCTANDTVEITSTSPPIAYLGPDTLVCKDQDFTLAPPFQNSNYFWNTGSEEPTITVSGFGDYWVTMTNVCGSTSDTINVDDLDCSCTIYFPNSFTPSGDGINEGFFPMYSCEFNHYELHVFNRWGEIVFSTEDPNEIWYGTYRGQTVIDGTYTYRVIYSDYHKIPITYLGHVTVIR